MSKLPMQILYNRDIEKKHRKSLKSLLGDEFKITYIPSDEKEKAINKAHRFDVVIGARLSKEFLDQAKNLKYYIIPFTGIPSDDRETLRHFPDIKVINLHFHSKYVAEQAWSLLLASAKKLCPFHNRLKQGSWVHRFQREWRGLALHGKTLLVIGYGHIGKKVAHFGKCFGMTVKAVKKTPGKAEEIDYLGTNKDLHDLLPEADFIIATLPLTESTKGYLGKEEFEKMKEGVHIVNVGRGEVIDEEAFYHALQSGKIGGAGIDTWWVYPSDKESRSNTFPSNYKLDEFDNIVFSPHRAGIVQEFDRERIKVLANKLKRINQGKIDEVVNISEGY